MTKSKLKDKVWLWFKRGFIMALISLIVNVILWFAFSALGVLSFFQGGIVITLLTFLVMIPFMLVWGGFIATWVVEHVH